MAPSPGSPTDPAHQSDVTQGDHADGVEQAQFSRFLKLAAPQAMAEVLRQMQTDLAACRDALERAAEGPDWPEVQRQSHSVMGLAGIAGADALHQRALALNQMAQQRPSDAAALRQGVPGLLATLQQQIDAIGRHLAAEGRAA